MVLQHIPKQQWTIIDFDMGGAGPLYFNDGGGWDSNANQFVCPDAGVYQFNTTVSYKNGTVGSHLDVILSCTPWEYVTYGATVRPTGSGEITLSATFKCGWTDWVYVEVCSDENFDIIIGKSSFSGRLVYDY